MIVFPMAGHGSRFRTAGYTTAKFLLPVIGEPVIRHVLRSFTRYAALPFVFVLRDPPSGAANEIRAACHEIGATPVLVELQVETAGQADTVRLGIERSDDSGGPVVIFNIDTFRVPYARGTIDLASDGFLETFQAPGDHWSFVLPDSDGRGVRDVVEKRRISAQCCSGLYVFRDRRLFAELHRGMLRAAWHGYSEHYVAPMYRLALAWGCRLTFQETPSQDLFFAGTPAEYEALLEDPRLPRLAELQTAAIAHRIQNR